MRIHRAAISLAAIAGTIVFAAWLAGGGELLSSGTQLSAGSAGAVESTGLWVGGESRSRQIIAGDVRREDASTPEAPGATCAERARENAGVLVRVVDRAGQPTAGVLVGLILEPSALVPYSSSFDVEIATSSFIADPVIAHVSPSSPAEAPPGRVPVLSSIPILSFTFTTVRQGWVPPQAPDTSEIRPFAEIQTTDVRGEVLFAREKQTPDERWFVQLALPHAPSPDREVPAGVIPAAEIEWTLDGLRRIELVCAEDDGFSPGPWQVRVFSELLRDREDAPAWGACDSVRSLAPGSAGELLAETSARVMIEVWQELPFWPRLRFVLEPHGALDAVQRCVLDARDHVARAKLVLEVDDGRRLPNIWYATTLWDGLRESAFDIETREEGALELYLDAREPFGPGAHLRFAMPSKIISDENEAHLELSSSITAGVTYDFGVLVLGTGPLLYAGEVVDGVGQAVARARVHCDERGETIECDELGRFARRGFTRDPRFVLHAEAPGMFARRTSVAAGSTNVRLELHRAARLSGRVRTPRELEVAAVEVRIRASMPDGVVFDRTNEIPSDGRFELEGLPAGAVRFELRWRDLVLYCNGWELAPGLRDLGELDLGSAIAPLRARVLRVDGSPAANAEVLFELFEGETRIAAISMRTSAEGRVLCWLPSGATRFAATAEGAAIEGTSGGDAEHVLRLAR